MAKIKFALEMKDGVKVRTLEELQTHFDLEKALLYFFDGKLEKWLEDRYYDQEVQALVALNREDADFQEQFCQILGVQCESSLEANVNAIAQEYQKREKLRQLTDNEDILAHAGDVAFTQEEMEQLIHAGKTTVYLCGEQFTIPIRETSLTYIGIPGITKATINGSFYDLVTALATGNIIIQDIILPPEYTFDLVINLEEGNEA